MSYPTFAIRTSSQLTPVLKRLRRERGLTQAAFGKLVGLSQERISAIENHPERVTIDQLFTILMALGAEVAIQPRPRHQSSPAEAPSAPESW